MDYDGICRRRVDFFFRSVMFHSFQWHSYTQRGVDERMNEKERGREKAQKTTRTICALTVIFIHDRSVDNHIENVYMSEVEVTEQMAGRFDWLTDSNRVFHCWYNLLPIRPQTFACTVNCIVHSATRIVVCVKHVKYDVMAPLKPNPIYIFNHRKIIISMILYSKYYYFFSWRVLIHGETIRSRLELGKNKMAVHYA